MKSLLTYVMMVFIPIAGVLGVLHAGRDLRAPHAIGGEWRIGAGPLAGSSFVVQQSGEHLSFVLPVKGGIQMRGRSRGDTLELRNGGLPITRTEMCDPVGGTTLRAVLDLATVPGRMKGSATVGGEHCPPIPFDAVRAPKPGRKGGGH
ncbi:MAG TPA: hypothetical protein VF710_01940 [Longimicrobium sp.]|jgi:hypothetical protein